MKKPLGKFSVLACYLGQQALLWVSIQYHHNAFIHEIPLFDEKLQLYNRIILQSGGRLLAQVKAQSEGDLCSISFTLPMKVVSTPSAFDGVSVGQTTNCKSSPIIVPTNSRKIAATSD